MDDRSVVVGEWTSGKQAILFIIEKNLQSAEQRKGPLQAVSRGCSPTKTGNVVNASLAGA